MVNTDGHMNGLNNVDTNVVERIKTLQAEAIDLRNQARKTESRSALREALDRHKEEFAKTLRELSPKMRQTWKDNLGKIQEARSVQGEAPRKYSDSACSARISYWSISRGQNDQP